MLHHAAAPCSPGLALRRVTQDKTLVAVVPSPRAEMFQFTCLFEAFGFLRGRENPGPSACSRHRGPMPRVRPR